MTSPLARTTASPAGLARRLGALLYDLLLLTALWMSSILVLVVGNDGQAVSASWLPVLLYLEAAAYYLYSWVKSGQTLGMKTWRLKLVNLQGEAVDVRAAFIRLLTAPCSALAAGLGYLAYYWSPHQQTWHDQLSQTYVLVLPKD